MANQAVQQKVTSMQGGQTAPSSQPPPAEEKKEETKKKTFNKLFGIGWYFYNCSIVLAIQNIIMNKKQHSEKKSTVNSMIACEDEMNKDKYG